MTDTFIGSILFTHILPAIMGFVGIIFLANGIMDSDDKIAIIGAVLFALAIFLPFIILPIAFGV